MSTISTTPRRPSTAQPTTLSTRMPYEAGEALLWERQNARVHTHLSLQMKELQAQHAAYESRIAATEAIAEAAEAAIHQVKQLDLKVKAIEEEEKDRPFDEWAKEAVGQLQVAVDGLKGVRGKISGLERKFDGLEEEFDGVRSEGALLRSLARRLEVLEGERKDEAMGTEQQNTARHRQEDVYDEALADDNPLLVFYGIDTQSPAQGQEPPSRHQKLPSRRHESPVRYQEPSPRQKNSVRKIITASRQKQSVRKHNQSLQHHHGLTGDLQPPDENTQMLGDDEADLKDAAHETNYGWENTQQFKDMQRELAELRAMCRTQEPKNSNDSADATQIPQETLIVHRENNLGLSDATTEAEAEFNEAGRSPSLIGDSLGQVGLLK